MTREEATTKLKWFLESNLIEDISGCEGLEEAIDMAIEALSNTPNALNALDCISRQAVLDYIDNMPSELTADGRRMIRRIRLTKYIQDSLPSVQQWISCTERLPDTEGRYLCTQLLSGDLYIMVYSFSLDLYDVDEYDFPNHGAGWYDLDSEYGYCEEQNVVAWMELPEAYKEGE